MSVSSLLFTQAGTPLILEHQESTCNHIQISLSNKATLFANNYGHIREVAFGEREGEANTFGTSSGKGLWPYWTMLERATAVESGH